MADIIYANRRKISNPEGITTNFNLGHDITKQLGLKEDVAAPVARARILSTDGLKLVHVETSPKQGYIGNVFAISGEKEELDKVYMALFEFYNIKGYE